EFAATYVELRHLAPDELADSFPALRELDAVDQLVALDLDAPLLVRHSHPAGALEPCGQSSDILDDQDDDDLISTEERDPVGDYVIPERSRASENIAALLRRGADRAAALGNTVGAAILQTRAARLSTPARAGQAHSAARDMMVQL